MKTLVKPIASTLLLALAPGCYRHGALLAPSSGRRSSPRRSSAHARLAAPCRLRRRRSAGYVWQPGYWSLEHDEWVWVEGRWIARYPGYDWERRIGSKIPAATGG